MDTVIDVILILYTIYCSTLYLSLLGHRLPLGNGALQDHLTGSNFPAKVMVRHFRRA